jgi:hypothetical protein
LAQALVLRGQGRAFFKPSHEGKLALLSIGQYKRCL